MSKKVIIFALIAFTIIAVVALFHSISPYTTPAQLKDMKSAVNVQVVGRMKDVHYTKNSTIFYLYYKNSEVKVVYPGRISPINDEIVVVGNWKNGVLYGEQILRKCHTQYVGG